jgi:hypothetical protein
MDYLATAIGIAAFTLLMNLWVHTPVRAAQIEAPAMAVLSSSATAS